MTDTKRARELASYDLAASRATRDALRSLADEVERLRARQLPDELREEARRHYEHFELGMPSAVAVRDLLRRIAAIGDNHEGECNGR